MVKRSEIANGAIVAAKQKKKKTIKGVGVGVEVKVKVEVRDEFRVEVRIEVRIEVRVEVRVQVRVDPSPPSFFHFVLLTKRLEQSGLKAYYGA